MELISVEEDEECRDEGVCEDLGVGSGGMRWIAGRGEGEGILYFFLDLVRY